MAASQLHSSFSPCIRQQTQKIVREKQGVTFSLATRQGLAFPVRVSSGPLYAMAASTLQQQVEVCEKQEVLEKEEQASGAQLSRIEIRTLRGCRLGIAMYPDFVYNAEGGGGPGSAEELPDGKLAVEFDIKSLYIPAVEWRTTKFLGLPLPPFLCIQVVPQSLKGFIERARGKVELEFSANFLFSVGSLYRAPPLVVNTLLTTETTEGRLRMGQGRRLDSDGKCRLAGVAPLVPIQDAFMNAFLTLPTDCLAIMEAQFSFSS
ncbi:hypothetical protein GOP47_0007688 [Adiantum capillus-veneris]|uniref:Uncharacterized protein n=1 Tax=Adiantum capillus-veneris TaxID=13818 RepID=A0A9D4V1B4_ADICA|nr:hypothetical protein GOP47_0007688 [Adiantum capillus-veneris]